MENRKNLYQCIRAIAECHDDMNHFNADKLNEAEMERATVTYMRALGASAYEVIVESETFDDVLTKVMCALEAKPNDRKELFQEIGELLLKGAKQCSKIAIEQCIDEVISNMKLDREFYPSLFNQAA